MARSVQHQAHETKQPCQDVQDQQRCPIGAFHAKNANPCSDGLSPIRAQQSAKHPHPPLAITKLNSGADERQTVLRSQKPPRTAQYG
jgi:hypothetical protein